MNHPFRFQAKRGSWPSLRICCKILRIRKDGQTEEGVEKNGRFFLTPGYLVVKLFTSIALECQTG